MKTSFLIFVLAIIALAVSGCYSTNMGSSTIVGEQLVFPDVSTPSENLTVKVLESMQGARVWTAKDSKVTIKYDLAYTNVYLSCIERMQHMTLYVTIKPLFVGEENAVAGDGAEGVTTQK